MDTNVLLEDIKAIKTWTYIENESDPDDTIKNYLEKLKAGSIQFGTNIYANRNPFPAIVLIISSVNNKNDNPGCVVALIKLIEQGKIDINNIIYFEDKIDTEDDCWEGVKIKGRPRIIEVDKEADKEDFDCLINAIESVLKSKNYSLVNGLPKNFSKQIIFYGPPGTGKTREAKIRAAEITGIAIETVDEEIEKPDGRIKLVQFHPSYSYFDFVEGIEAEKNGFELKDKVFKEFANRAANGAANSVEETTDNANETENNNYVLIIDEINRANMASVFGELLYALEYRGKSIDTSGGQLVVPDNLYIIGTMNTADVSIAGIDYAVRRRFDFIKMNSRMPDGVFYIAGENKPYEIRGNSLIYDNDEHDFATEWIYDEQDNLSSYKVEDKWFISNLYNRVRIDVQNSVARGVNVEDIMPGISYFLVNNKKENNNDNGEVDKDHLNYKIDYEIAPLLLEYAKNGLFSKRYKIDGDKSLYDMLKNMEYSERLKKWIEKKG